MNDTARLATQGIDKARLDAVLQPIVRAHGGELVDFEFKSEAGGWVLRVFVEKLGSAESNASTQDAAVDLELCSNVARDLSPALDVADLIPHRYHLEISSPGVERNLKAARDFVRFAGKKAKIKVNEAVKGQKVLVGILGQLTAPATDASGSPVVSLQDGSSTFSIALDNIVAARLVFEFGPSPKPGKPKPKK